MSFPSSVNKFRDSYNTGEYVCSGGRSNEGKLRFLELYTNFQTKLYKDSVQYSLFFFPNSNSISLKISVLYFSL